MYTAFLSSLFIVGALSKPLEVRQEAALWQPEVGAKWQIVISAVPDTSRTISPSDAGIWDVDLFEVSASDVSRMKSQGKKVICYYSAGTSENWRPDYSQFSPSDIGSSLPDWQGENYLNMRSAGVMKIMKARIQKAADLGCDAIDPDNMDVYSNGGGGFGLTTSDATNYLQQMASYASTLGMSTGLKNAQEILPSVSSFVQFAVNEECVAQTDRTTKCTEYNDFLAAGKPVFHIEYVTSTASASQLSTLCNTSINGNMLSTVIKYLSLDGWVQYCDGSVLTTATK